MTGIKVTEMGAELILCLAALSPSPGSPCLSSLPLTHRHRHTHTHITHILPSRYTEEMPPAIWGNAEIKLTEERNES